MEWREYIERKPSVLDGQPVFKGTRMAVQLVLKHLGDGWSEHDLLEQYPTLRAEHIRAAQAYAADAIDDDSVVFLDRLSG